MEKLGRPATPSRPEPALARYPDPHQSSRPHPWIQAKDEVLAQKKYLVKQIERIDNDLASASTSERDELAQALAVAEEVLDTLVDVKHALKFDQTIEQAAQWIDRNMSNTSNKPMADLSKSMYAIASGIAHGYTWTTNYLQDTTDLSNIVADFLYAATTTTEAAVALYEAQASADGEIGESCPSHLRDTAERLYRTYAAGSPDLAAQAETGSTSAVPL